MLSTLYRRMATIGIRPVLRRNLCTETLAPSFSDQKYDENDGSTEKAASQSFATLLRNSPFTQLGNPVGKVNTTVFDSISHPQCTLFFQVVIGKIYHVVDDDLYIDFGHKFHCVCTRPRGPGSGMYTRGQEVKLRIKRLESSEKFLGFDSEMSLLEAECTLMGLNK